MKAFLLAGGLGTRLRPLTDRTPKCIVEVGGRPMLDIWLDALAEAGVDEVLVNTHHLAELVEAHVAARTAYPVVRLSHEPELLGSAGTLRANRDFVAGEDLFLALYADNLTDFDLRVLVEAHRAGGRVATLTVFRAPRPSECGIVEVDRRTGGRASWRSPRTPRAIWRTRGSTPSTRVCSTRSPSRCRGTSASTCCRGSWAGPGGGAGKQLLPRHRDAGGLELARNAWRSRATT